MFLEIKPLYGVGPIKFGMTSQEVQDAMKESCGNEYKYSRSGDTDYFFGSALEVSYDDEGKAEFIGTQYYLGCGCDFILYGIDPFSLEASALFEHIASQQLGSHIFDPADYLFRDAIITLWNSDEQYDHKGGEQKPVYAQVGVGNDIYLHAIDKIEKA